MSECWGSQIVRSILALLDCKLAVDDRNPSGYVFSNDRKVVHCPGRYLELPTYNTLDVLMELLDACRPRSLHFFRSKISLLSSQFANLMKETISNHPKAQVEFAKVSKQS